MSENDEKENVEEFNKVVDATSDFLKAVYPHGKKLVKKIKTKVKNVKNEINNK